VNDMLSILRRNGFHCGPIGALPWPPGNVEHIGRRRKPRETGAQDPHQFLPLGDRHAPSCRRARGARIAVMQVNKASPRASTKARIRVR